MRALQTPPASIQRQHVAQATVYLFTQPTNLSFYILFISSHHFHLPTHLLARSLPVSRSHLFPHLSVSTQTSLLNPSVNPSLHPYYANVYHPPLIHLPFHPPSHHRSFIPFGTRHCIPGCESGVVGTQRSTSLSLIVGNLLPEPLMRKQWNLRILRKAAKRIQLQNKKRERSGGGSIRFFRFCAHREEEKKKKEGGKEEKREEEGGNVDYPLHLRPCVKCSISLNYPNNLWSSCECFGDDNWGSDGAHLFNMNKTRRAGLA